MFQPVGGPKGTRLYEKVVMQIKSAISVGDLKPGDKLPSERELAEIFGVSRTSIREALKSLVAMGLIKIRHGDGIYVCESRGEEQLKNIGAYLMSHQGTLKDLFEIRRVLETEAAAWAAERGAPEKVQELVNLINTVKEGIAKRSGGYLLFLGEHDTKFHLCLAEASENQVLLRVMNNLLDLLAESRARAWSIPGRPLRSVEEHAKIVEAIVSGDVEGAREAMRQHLENVEKEIL
ncbi:FadR/GntR family transcriptional regulator [Calderihabitans maritimus]|uniref:GntR family transcriptional regulator n=1 Tax=Calderihabitans maritimus TaxID=1246530 RepID=A0A1Z5HWK4_9FIRM|nr:FadR/GntR family transcriptional regulator [Calderihabitans maritimus]GAW93913.1 GntR family transcriptional regulator [Calderihabitans maritimus]